MNTSPSPNLNVSLSSLALLSLRMGDGEDYLDYLHGFVIGALHQIKTPSFDANTVHAIIQSEFGLKIPAATLAIYLKRLQKPKIIEPTPDGHQFRILKLPDSTLGADRLAARGRINEVLQKLKEYAFLKYTLQWTEEQSASVLTDFIREYSVDFVRFAEYRSPLPDPGADSQTERFIVASFIKHCADASPGVFESVKTLVESHILANALLCPDLKDRGTGYKNIIFVLDTRLLLKAFDLEATIDTENTRTLLESVRRLKGALCIFPETKEEIRMVLNGIKRGFLQGGARGPQVEELRKRGRGVADVILAESRLEDKLKDLMVSTLPSPPYDEKSYLFQIDEDELRDLLEEELGHMAGKAANHDIHAVRSIFALRKGRRVSRIEDAGFVFLTTNSALSRAAFRQQKSESAGWVFSAVITDFHLSHLTWLKSPIDAGDLARTELLSSCHAAMRPPQPVWRKYLAEADRLKTEGKFTEQDHEVLKLSLKAPEELMEVTRGEVDGITEANLRTILNRLEQTYAKEKAVENERLRSERESLQKELTSAQVKTQEKESQLSETVAREERLREKAAADEKEIERLKFAELEFLAKERRQREKIDRISNRVATGAYIVAWIVFAIFGVLALLTNWSPWLAVPGALIGLLNIGAGFSGASVRGFVRKKVEHYLSGFTK